MKTEHRVAREMLKRLPKTKAKTILQELLPEREFLAIFYCDVEGWPREKVGEEKIFCEPRHVTRIKSLAYRKLIEEMRTR